MIHLELTHPDGQRQQMQVPGICSIGKGTQCELRLAGWGLAQEHARLLKSRGGVLLDAGDSFTGVQVNGRRIETQCGPLQASDIIGIGPFRLRVLDPQAPPGDEYAPAPAVRDSAEPVAPRPGTGPNTPWPTPWPGAAPTIPRPGAPAMAPPQGAATAAMPAPATPARAATDAAPSPASHQWPPPPPNAWLRGRTRRCAPSNSSGASACTPSSSRPWICAAMMSRACPTSTCAPRPTV